jgi:hypothetical protein
VLIPQKQTAWLRKVKTSLSCRADTTSVDFAVLIPQKQTARYLLDIKNSQAKKACRADSTKANSTISLRYYKKSS